MRFETRAIHAGRAVDPSTGAVVPPIHLATTFERAPSGEYPRGFVYGRSGNPNRAALEACLADLESGASAAAFASGSAATSAVFSSLDPSDHVLAPTDVYHGTARLLREHFGRWGLDATFVDMSDAEAVATALRPKTKLVWIETPSNPLLKIADIARIAELAHAAGARVCVDNTWASPVLQRPLDLGADLALHATTKYLGGHGDVTGGAVVSREEDAFFARLRQGQVSGGAVPSPFDCWLVLRGIRTLPYRMRAHSENARRVAEFLVSHPAVAVVHFPGLPGHPGHAIAARQMADFGGMLSFEVRPTAGDPTGRDRAFAVAARVRLFTRATSLGGTESLIEHRASIEGPETKTPPGLLRLSVGLEHPDDLIEDLTQALVGERPSP